MAKGASFERKISKMISIWWTGRDDCVWRTAGSGGRATVRLKKNVETLNCYGDLCYTHPLTKNLFDIFVFELKKGYQNVDVLSLVDSFSKVNKIYVWWKKLMRLAERINREPILILERNRKNAVVIFNHESTFLIPKIIKYPPGYLRVLLYQKGLYLGICLLDDFLNDRYFRFSDMKPVPANKELKNVRRIKKNKDGEFSIVPKRRYKLPSWFERNHSKKSEESKQYREDNYRKSTSNVGDKSSVGSEMVLPKQRKKKRLFKRKSYLLRCLDFFDKERI
jgi:hypothetical protein